MVDQKVITPNDLVAYYREDGGMESAGYLISSVFDNNKLPPIVTINGESVKGAASLQTGGKSKKGKSTDDSFSNSLRGLAIPLGLASLFSNSENYYNSEINNDNDNNDSFNSNMEGGKNRYHPIHDSEIVSIPIYDRLLHLVSLEEKPKKVRKTKKKTTTEHKSKKSRKTKKN